MVIAEIDRFRGAAGGGAGGPQEESASNWGGRERKSLGDCQVKACASTAIKLRIPKNNDGKCRRETPRRGLPIGVENTPPAEAGATRRASVCTLARRTDLPPAARNCARRRDGITRHPFPASTDSRIQNYQREERLQASQLLGHTHAERTNERTNRRAKNKKHFGRSRSSLNLRNREVGHMQRQLEHRSSPEIPPPSDSSDRACR